MIPSIQSSFSSQPLAAPEEPYLRKLAALVAQIYVTLSEIAKTDRSQIVEIERTYTHLSHESADCMRSKGSLSLKTGCGSLAFFVASLAFQSANDRQFVQLFSQKMTDFTSPFSYGYEARLKINDSLSSLENTHLQEKTNHSQETSIKDQFARILSDELQRLRQAATSN